MDEKIDLIQAHRHEYGLNVCLRAVGLSKGTWHYRRHRKSQAERDAPLKAEIVSVIEAHPDYGLRRIHAELVERMARPINPKRLRRVLKHYGPTALFAEAHKFADPRRCGPGRRSG